MKYLLLLLITMTFCACDQEVKQRAASNKPKSQVKMRHTDTFSGKQKTGIESADLNASKWEQHEDSLRREILKAKANRDLAKSFLQELYIRNVVSATADSVFVDVPFDMHSPDAGAPDCYVTDVRFRFKFGEPLRLPKKVKFTEHEYGCVNKDRKISGSFQLLERTRGYVIYHSATPKRTLVLFSSNQKYGTTAFYFVGLRKDRINGQNLFHIIENYNPRDGNTIYPYTSWVLTTNEYENFIPH